MKARRPVIAVIGRGEALPPGIERLAEQVGQAAIDAGCRLVTGGMGGVMAAASRGARSSPGHQPGDILGILPGEDAAEANAWVDWALPTGMGIARNALVVRSADAVIAISGGAGTLSELAMAWQLGKPIVALAGTHGWAEKLAEHRIDERRNDPILLAETADDALRLALSRL